jgi:uncharacterized damage-inducible protein DinB
MTKTGYDNRRETLRIADQLDRAINGRAWHGSSVMQLLKGVSATQAAAHPIPNAHSIAEIVAHAAAWLEIVRRRVEGTAPKRISPRMNWPAVGSGAEEWRATMERLRRAAADLRATIESLEDAGLDRTLPGVNDTWSTFASLHGVVQHTLYHAGQIALLKKGTVRHASRH